MVSDSDTENAREVIPTGFLFIFAKTSLLFCTKGKIYIINICISNYLVKLFECKLRNEGLLIGDIEKNQ